MSGAKTYAPKPDLATQKVGDGDDEGCQMLHLLRGDRERVCERLYREGGVRVLDLFLRGGVEERLLGLQVQLGL